MRKEVIGAATLYCGDCRDVLPTFPRIDAVVTDPPYGLSFMGKGWDRGVPGVEFWTSILAAMKPGAHAVSFGGTRTYHRMACAVEDAGFDIRDAIMWHYAQGFPKHKNALKPATEVIALARRPGAAGALNIDACRVAGESTGEHRNNVSLGSASGGIYGSADSFVSEGHPAGRWPANVLHDGSDEVLRAFPDTKSGTLRRGPYVEASQWRAHEGRVAAKMHAGFDREGDNGSAARFFYCAKANKVDRGEGNDHPTVKPHALMRWLCRLITPPGGTVLDPFMGSGSTGRAALAEGFRFVGVEQDAHYFEIACRRIEAAQRQRDLLTVAA